MDVKIEPTFEANCEAYVHPPNGSKKLSPEAVSEPRRKRTRPRGIDSVSGMDDEYDAIGKSSSCIMYTDSHKSHCIDKLVSRLSRCTRSHHAMTVTF